MTDTPVEQKFATAATPDEYIDQTIGQHTHRRRSEVEHKPIHFQDARKATHVMRSRLEEVYRGFPDVSFDAIPWKSYDELESQYDIAIAQIPQGGLVNPDSKAADFLKVNPYKYPEAIKAQIETQYGERSIAHSFLNIVGSFEKEFGLSPQEGAHLGMRILTTYLPEMAEATQKEHVPDSEAALFAFEHMTKQMPHIIEEIKNAQQSLGYDVKKALAQVLLSKSILKTPQSHEPAIPMTPLEQEGFVEAYHLQDRPYTEQEIQLADRLLEQNHYLKSTFVAFQLLFTQYSLFYLKKHPERMNQNLEPYNPIFVPVRNDMGEIVSLSPNPKLLKTMSNNWIPAIARQLISERPDSSFEDLSPSALTPDTIRKAISNAESFSIFSSILGEFQKTDDPEIIHWKGTFPIACPAKNMFTQSGAALIPSIYEYLQTVQE